MKSVKLKKYRRNGKDCYLDPFRKKLIYVTPEETVRQNVLSYLTDELGIPERMIVVEQILSHYNIKSKKRADIVIHCQDNNGGIIPIAVVECKAPDVYLDDRARDQLKEYCDMIGVDYGMLTNGISKVCMKYDYENECYIYIDSLPKFDKMMNGEYTVYDIGELPPRIPFNEIEPYLCKEFASYEPDYYGEDVSKLTPMKLAVPSFNFLECLLDARVRMPCGDYEMFELIEDYGVRMMSYGNSSGGIFYGPYRSFLVKIGENTEFYSIAVSTYWKGDNKANTKTCISVAHDDEKNSHHALQLIVDDNVTVIGNKINFYHHGRIAVGNIGSGKIADLRIFVEKRCPRLISGNRFYLGSLINDRLWRLDDPEVIKLIVNLITYAMIRDEYRNFLKNSKKRNK